jgi:tetratricopeptide (TPR) repeat protein
MRHAILSLLTLTGLIAAGPALAAKAQGDKAATQFSSSIDEMQLSGTVEVPLYDVPGFETVPVVAAQVGDTRLFLALDPTGDRIVLSGPRVKALGLEGSGKKDGELESTEVDNIQVGEMSLSGVEVATKFPIVVKRWSRRSSIGRTQVLSLDGYIGLSALEGVAWAILPSEGVVRFAPAGTTGLLDDGATVPTVTKPPSKLTVGTSTSWEYGTTTVPVSFNGSELQLRLGFFSTGSVIPASLKPEGAEVYTWQGSRRTSGSLQLAGASLDRQTVVLDHTPDHIRDNIDLPPEQRPGDGYIGRGILGLLDIARDNTSGLMSFSYAKVSKRHDPVPLMLADAEAALAKSKETPPDAEEEVQKDTTLPEGSKDAWEAVARAREAAGDYPGSLEAWKTAARFAPTGCQGWLDYGLRAVEYGNAADAEEALQTASSLYHAWWDWNPQVRTALGEVLEKAAQAEQDYYFDPADINFIEIDGIRERDVAMGAPGPRMPEQGALIKSQPGTCDVADGALAGIAFVKGDTEAVETLYRAHFDLDRYIADIQGTSALVSGQPQKAHEAIRQAILREWHTGPDSYRRANLAHAYIADGDRQQAQALLDRAVELDHYSLTIFDQWRANALELLGPRTALVAAQNLAKVYPTSVQAHLNWHATAVAAGVDAAAASALAKAEELLTTKMIHHPNRASNWVARSRIAVIQGKAPQAMSSARKATKLDPGLGAGWLAAAEAAELADNADEAAEFRTKAAQVSPRIYHFSQVLADSTDEE